MGSRVDARAAAIPGLLNHGDAREYLQDDLASIGHIDGLAIQRPDYVQHLFLRGQLHHDVSPPPVSCVLKSASTGTDP
eukprot:5198625-Heterocapsa_arctica.AAC.1